MSYIGRGLDKISNIEHLDTITFDGSSSYSLTKSSVAFTPNSAQSILISIDGVVQSNNFTCSGSTIDFGVAVPSTSTCDFIKHFGTGVAFTPADGTVTTAKLADASVTSAKLASGVGGKILQVVTTSYTTLISTTSTSFTEITGLTTSITPSSTSSKILIQADLMVGSHTASGGNLQLKRDTTILGSTNNKWWYFGSSAADCGGSLATTYLDSPSSTSAISYKFFWRADNSNGVYLNQTQNYGVNNNEYGQSDVILMEISA